MKLQRVALYARVSTDGQSVENQLRELRGVAERHGWQIVGEFVDRGISGAKGRDQRPQFSGSAWS
jgi:DNA invertase Pin-like site-specific DNA recombinase